MKNETLTTDEYDALGHIERGARSDRANPCVGRNAKRLNGLKMIQYGRDGGVALTEKGQQMLFMRRAVAGLRAVLAEPGVGLDPDVATFLGRKSHIAAREEGGFEITDKGRESLADIDARQPAK